MKLGWCIFKIFHLFMLRFSHGVAAMGYFLVSFWCKVLFWSHMDVSPVSSVMHFDLYAVNTALEVNSTNICRGLFACHQVCMREKLRHILLVAFLLNTRQILHRVKWLGLVSENRISFHLLISKIVMTKMEWILKNFGWYCTWMVRFSYH